MLFSVLSYSTSWLVKSWYLYSIVSVESESAFSYLSYLRLYSPIEVAKWVTNKMNLRSNNAWYRQLDNVWIRVGRTHLNTDAQVCCLSMIVSLTVSFSHLQILSTETEIFIPHPLYGERKKTPARFLLVEAMNEDETGWRSSSIILSLILCLMIKIFCETPRFRLLGEATSNEYNTASTDQSKY